jgi:hypothetical protein
MNPLSRVRPGSAVRGAGVALACLLPGLPGRARAVVATYAAGWPLNKPGVQAFMLVPDEDEEPWKRAVLPFATSAASWTAMMLLAVSAVRRSALPAPVAGVLLGSAVAVGDTALAEAFERMKARAAEAAAARDEESAVSDDSRD